MIGHLPTSLPIGERSYKVRSDYRPCIAVLQAVNDPELSEADKVSVMLEILFEEIPEDVQEACKQACWFLDCGRPPREEAPPPARLMDWEQDEQLIFAAVNKVVGQSVRSLPYLHWWDFMGAYSEIGEGPFATVVGIRSKRAKGKALASYEQEYYNENREVIDLRAAYAPEDEALWSLLTTKDAS